MKKYIVGYSLANRGNQDYISIVEAPDPDKAVAALYKRMDALDCRAIDIKLIPLEYMLENDLIVYSE